MAPPHDDHTIDDTSNGTALNFIERANQQCLERIKKDIEEGRGHEQSMLAMFEQLMYMATETYKSVAHIKKTIKLKRHGRVKVGPVEFPVDFFNDPIRLLIAILVGYAVYLLHVKVGV